MLLNEESAILTRDQKNLVSFDRRAFGIVLQGEGVTSAPTNHMRSLSL